MNKINFMFAIHNHQPVGNFDGVFKSAFNDCYLPFIKVLEKHPKVKVSLHHTGPLLEWIEANHPEYFARIRALMEIKQVEIMGGGFYEPILPVIPERDALGQIKMMQDYIKAKFNAVPKGMWLAERVWEPSLPKIIGKAGMKYTAIDDTHFYYAGFKADDMTGYYITEDQGYRTADFTIDKELRYRIPFRLAHETIDYLRQTAERNNGAGVTVADDGEKFGVWPGTHKWVYDDGYLEDLFSKLEENSDWITMMTFSEYMEKNKAKGTAYLPTASYDEMMEWALPCDSQYNYEKILKVFKDQNKYEELRPYLRGGFWRNFLVKYSESNQMYSKMIHISNLIEKSNSKDIAKDKATKELYRSQCNCAYWHGLFGGLYLNYLRHALYSHMISAEDIISPKSDEVQRYDYNFDGNEEILVSKPDLNIYVSPSQGGQITELDYRQKFFNISNVLMRRTEAYHRKENIQNSKEAENILINDWYNRNSLIDHLFGDTATLENFSLCRHEEKGDFIKEPYLVTECDRSKIKMERSGFLGQKAFRINKQLNLSKNKEIRIKYTLSNICNETLGVWFGIEFNLTLLAGSDGQRYYILGDKDIKNGKMNKKSEDEDIKKLQMIDEYSGFKIILEWDKPGLLWRFPIETVNNSETGIETTYQGSCIVPSWKYDLSPGKSNELDILIQLENIK